MTDNNRDISAYPAEAQEYIRELRDEAKTNRLLATDRLAKISERDEAVATASTRLDELTAKVTAADAVRAQYDSLRDEHAQVLASSASTKLALDRVNIALAAGLPHTFAERLKGDDADALKADAEAFKASLGSAGSGAVAFDKTNTSGANVPELDSVRSAIASHLQQNQE